MACHHFLLLILQFGLSCAFHGPRPIQGYDILYLLADNTGFSDRFIRLGNPLNGTYPTTFPLVGSETPVIILAWTHLPVAERGSSDYVYNGTFDTDDDASDVLRQSLVQFRRYFSLKNAVVSLVLLDEVTYLSQFDDDPFSNWTIVNNSKIEGTHEDICILMYYCLFDIVLFSDDFPPDQLGFEACLRGKYDIIEEQFARATWRCYVQISSDDYAFSPDLTRLIIPPEYELTRFLNITRLFYNPNKLPCSSDDYNLVQENWMVKSVDYNLQVSLIGGVDRLGVYWQGGQVNEFFAETIGRQFWNLRGVKCTRATPCQPDLDCSRIGPYTALALGTTKKPVSIPWVLLASSAIKNINQQLVNQYDQLENAIESLALNAFTIDDFFPKKSQNPSLQNNLTGLSGIFTLGGFIPVGGPAIEAAGTIASSIGNFLSNSVSPASPTEAQDIFSQQVLVLYKALLSAMENVIAKLFEGVQLPTTPSLGLSSFNITDMMKGGAWVDPNAITNVSQLNLKVKTELLSRSIDSLWKTPPSNKMWVLFTDLKDDAKATSCNEDKKGPPDSKYCGDGGVYYTYNFIEQEGGGGGVGWPWGADQLNLKAGVKLNWVTEASAKSYRLMKQLGQDPFNFSQTIGTASYLSQAFTNRLEGHDLSEMYGRYPGSWTLPVCDMSDWGYRWNWDYTGADNKDREAYYTHPPCLCGPQALETYDWARAAGMQSFQTFWDRCKQVLRDPDSWPKGVTFVNYPANDPKDDFRVSKPWVSKP